MNKAKVGEFLSELLGGLLVFCWFGVAAALLFDQFGFVKPWWVFGLAQVLVGHLARTVRGKTE